MGKNLSPVVCRELENLDKDANSRKNAMKALKSYVRDLDSKAIPHFLAQVSATKEQGSCSGEYTISLYEVLARVHGRNIVPQIENIMSTILKTLSSSAGSFPLHQACSKVVPAIARYGIEPTTPHDEKIHIITSLCKPLANVLMGSLESLASGAALCLKALVESDNWRFASSNLINDLCLKVAGALEEKSNQTNAHMGLAMALIKHNSMTAEAYARSFLRSGLKILAVGTEEGNSQKRFSATQMINFLMKCVDSRSISSELAHVAEIMDKCQADPMPYIQGAAFEALQTAKLVSSRIGSRYEQPCVCSNFVGDYSERDLSYSPGFLSPESRTLDSFVGLDSLAESPLSSVQFSCNLGSSKRASRRLWNNEGSSVDISLKDGIFPGPASDGYGSRSLSDQFDSAGREETDRKCLDFFSGFAESEVTEVVKHNSPPNPRRPQSPISIHDATIFSTPRRLLRSLQDENDENSACRNVCQTGVTDTPVHAHLKLNQLSEEDVLQNRSWNCRHITAEQARKHEENRDGLNEDVNSSESVSSSVDHPAECTSCQISCKNCSEGKSAAQSNSAKGRCSKAAVSLVVSLCLALPVMLVSFMLTGGGDYSMDMVPT